MKFEDDGGTPAWRQQAIIEPADRWEPWRKLPFVTKAVTFLFLVFVLPWVIIVGGMVLLTLLDMAGITLG